MEDKNLVPFSDSELDDIRKFTGESGMIKPVRVPFLIFDARNGMFSKTTPEKDENGKSILENVGQSVTGVIIRMRKQIASSKDTKEKLYSREFEGYNDVVDLYSRDTKDVIATGTYTTLKDRFGKKAVKLNEVVYMFFEEQLLKLSVKGTSLAPLWEYASSFGKDDTVLRYNTILTSVDDSNEFGEFKVLKFTKGEPVADWRKLWNELKVLDASISSTAVKHINKLVPGVSENELPVIDVPEDDFPIDEAEEIDPSKIPF